MLALFAVVVTIIAGWALIKRYQTHMVLLFAGLAIFLMDIIIGGNIVFTQRSQTIWFCWL